MNAPNLFRHYPAEARKCQECGKLSDTVYNRTLPVGVELCACCFIEYAKTRETLTQALHSLGLGHKPSKCPGKRTIFNLETGEELSEFYNASEGWALVHKLRGDSP
jgi:hypothetical protein